MKTPRAFLLARHRSIERKLDAIAPAKLAAYALIAASEPARQSQPRSSFVSFMGSLWFESILPWRRTWCGLAAVWLVILALGVSSESVPQLAVSQPAPLTAETLAALREQRHLMAQLLEPLPPPEISRTKESGPRGERRSTPHASTCGGDAALVRRC